jgi:hypothetical protein
MWLRAARYCLLVLGGWWTNTLVNTIILLSHRIPSPGGLKDVFQQHQEGKHAFTRPHKDQRLIQIVSIYLRPPAKCLV